MKRRLLVAAVLSAALSAGAAAANHVDGVAYAAVSGAATTGVDQGATHADSARTRTPVPGYGDLDAVGTSTSTTESADPNVGDDQSDLNPAGIDPSSDRPEEMQPKIERPEVQRPEIERPDIGRPVIERPVIERPSIDR